MVDLAFIVLISTVVLLLLACLVWGKFLAQLPLNLETGHMGGLKLNTNALTLLILAALVAAYMAVTHFDSGAQAQARELEEVKGRLAVAQASLEQFRSYDMLFRLIFPEADHVQVRTIETQVYVCRQGEPPPQPIPAEQIPGFYNDIWVRVRHLNPGDTLKVVARGAGGREWESAVAVEVPRSDLEMRGVAQ